MNFRNQLTVLIVSALVILSGCTSTAIPLTGQTQPPAPLGVPTATPVSPAPTVLPTAQVQLQAPAATQAAPTPPQADPVLTQTSPSQNTRVVQPASSCVSPAALTPAVTEGPFFKAGSPERSSLLETGMAGTKLILSGYVLTADCKPVAHALLDFWQANSQGQYDNSGYTLRGHIFSDASGHYQLTTIIPGLYPGRTEHIHVKVQAPNGPILTTQLFVPGVVNNDSDSIYDPRLLMTLQDANAVKLASYQFIIHVQ